MVEGLEIGLESQSADLEASMSGRPRQSNLCARVDALSGAAVARSRYGPNGPSRRAQASRQAAAGGGQGERRGRAAHARRQARLCKATGATRPRRRSSGWGRRASTLTPEQAAAIEERARVVDEFRDQAERPQSPGAGQGRRQQGADRAGTTIVHRAHRRSAGGAVGGYNGFWLDPGNNVIRIDGVARSSIIIDPPNGRLPPLTAAGKQRLSERAALAKKFGEFDHPEMRPLSDRCLLSFGSNAGPPMLPNYFYNNNYTIVQTKDHVMILTEMVNDVRIIRLGAKERTAAGTCSRGSAIRSAAGRATRWSSRRPTSIRSSWRRPRILWAYRGASDDLKVTERFTRTGPDTILYRFTMEDPSTFTAPFTGELPFNRIDEQIYEYACHEGNYAMTNILAGERAKERRAAEQKKEQK